MVGGTEEGTAGPRAGAVLWLPSPLRFCRASLALVTLVMFTCD